MSRSLPPLAWFRAFECAARHLNFTHASNELHLTQSAVSQHIRSLEDRLGCALFIRQHRKLALTDEGRRLLPGVSNSIAQLKDATKLFDMPAGRNILTVSVSASIAQWYLVPGLKDFLGAHKDFDIRLISKIWPDEFSTGPTGVEIRYDSPDSAGSEFELLVPDSIVLVAAPGTEGELENHPLISVAGTNDTWENWLKITGRPNNLDIRCSVESHGLAIDCARAGVGIALTSFSVAAPAIEEGSLILFSPVFVPAIDGYYVSKKPKDSENPNASIFVDWLRDRINGSKYNALHAGFK